MVDLIRSRLRDLQDAYGSYAALARSMGVNRSTVARWASGSRRPSKRDRRRINERWRRSDKRLRNEGAVVNISSYFKRIWYDNGQIKTPLNYRRVPTWDFPNSAPVVITWKVKAEIVDVGGFETLDVVRNVPISSTESIAQAVEESFEEFVEKSKTSFRDLLKVVRDQVLIRWLKSA